MNKRAARIVSLVLLVVFFTNACCYGLAPELRTVTSEFKEFYTATSICKIIEQGGNLGSNSYLNDILPRIEALKKDYRNLSVTILPHEIVIEIPDEGMAVRYFDPRNANIVTPFSNISGLRTKIINNGLSRQIIYRAKALPVPMDVDVEVGIKIETVKDDQGLEQYVAIIPLKRASETSKRDGVVVNLGAVQAFFYNEYYKKPIETWKDKYPIFGSVNSRSDLARLKIWPITRFDSPNPELLQWCASLHTSRSPPSTHEQAVRISFHDLRSGLHFVPGRKTTIMQYPELVALIDNVPFRFPEAYFIKDMQAILAGGEAASRGPDWFRTFSGLPQTWEGRRCSNCGSDAFEVIHVIGPARVVRCRTCGLSGDNPAAIIPRIDLDKYASTAHDKSKSASSMERAQGTAKNFMEKLRMIRPDLIGSPLLEIGCASGEFLSVLRQWYGWTNETLTGVEPSKQCVSFAREQFGLDVREGEVRDVARSAKKFKVIVILNTVEHFYDPRKVMEDVSGILEPGGVVFIGTVPNEACIASTLFPEGFIAKNFPDGQHFHQFNPETLKSVCENAGFSVIRMDGETRDMAARQERETAMWLAYSCGVSIKQCKNLDTMLGLVKEKVMSVQRALAQQGANYSFECTATDFGSVESLINFWKRVVWASPYLSDDFDLWLERKEQQTAKPALLTTSQEIEGAVRDDISLFLDTRDISILEKMLLRLSDFARTNRDGFDKVTNAVRAVSKDYPILTDNYLQIALLSIPRESREIIKKVIASAVSQKADMKRVKVLILAAGVGMRIWPKSTLRHPKQLIKGIILSGRSSLQETIWRLTQNGFIDAKQIYVMTTKSLQAESVRQAAEVGVRRENFLIDPFMSGTSMAIGYAAKYFEKQDPDSTMLILNSDIHLTPVEEFQSSVSRAIDMAVAGPYLISIGVRPDSPSTQYGYVELGCETEKPGVYRANRFVEKPSRETALEFFNQKECFVWEGGMQAWSTRTILRAFDEFSPFYSEVMPQIRTYLDGSISHEEFVSLHKGVADYRNNGLPTAIDYVIFEPCAAGKSPNINFAAVPSNISWVDIGNLWSPARQINQNEIDKNGNLILGTRDNIVCEDTKDSNVFCDTKRKIFTKGLNKTVLADNDHADSTLAVSSDAAMFSKGVTKDLVDAGLVQYAEGRHVAETAHSKVLSGTDCIVYSNDGLAMTNGLNNSILIRLNAAIYVYGPAYREEGLQKLEALLKDDINDPRACIDVVWDESGNMLYAVSKNEDYHLRFTKKRGNTSLVFIEPVINGQVMAYEIKKENKRPLSMEEIEKIWKSLGSEISSSHVPAFNYLLSIIERVLSSSQQNIAWESPAIETTEVKTAIVQQQVSASTIKNIGTFTDTPMTRAQKWLLDSGIQNLTNDEKRKGGINGYYDPNSMGYPFLYSEISGYALSLFVHMYIKTGDKIFLERAALTADWLIKQALHERGGVRTKLYYTDKDEANDYYSFRNEKLFAFDSGIVLRGMIDLYKATQRRDYLDVACRIADFLIGMQREDGFLNYGMYGKTGEILAEDNNMWSRQRGSFYTKCMERLVDIYELTGDKKYKDAVIRLCDAALSRQTKDGRFISVVETGDTFLHSHCYSAEGLVYVGEKLNEPRYIEAARKATEWIFDHQLEDGGVPQWFDQKSGLFRNYQRCDISAQALRLGIYFYKRGDLRSEQFLQKLEKLKDRVVKFQVEGGGQGGGFVFGRNFDGAILEDVNSWHSFFAMHALIEYEEMFTTNSKERGGNGWNKAPPDEKTYSDIQSALKDKPDTKICFVLGTRPEIIKVWPVIHYCDENKIPYFIIHTNQHYSQEMSSSFFLSLNIPIPKYNLNRPADLTDRNSMIDWMSAKMAPIMQNEKPSMVIVQGDTNSTYAGALTASRINIPIGHIEAGLRSYDMSMPEELNRIAVDRLAKYCFCPTELQVANLQREGIVSADAQKKAFVTGNTIVDAVNMATDLINQNNSLVSPNLFENFGVKKKRYFLLTLHRPDNVDNEHRLRQIVESIEKISKKYNTSVLFLVHPRTKTRLDSFNIALPDCFILEQPVGNYFDMIELERSARLVFTDSGGIQEESSGLKFPCVVLRKNTERPEAILAGSSILTDVDEASMEEAVRMMLKRSSNWQNPFDKGKTSEAIIKAILGVSLPEIGLAGSTEKTPSNQIDYINSNKMLFNKILGEGKQDVLARIPIETIESIGIDNIKNFLAAFQEAPNGYIELYYMSGIGEVSESVYQKYSLQKKSLPKNFKRTRENTVTLFPALKGEEINQSTIVSRLGSLNIAPENTILSPIGLQHDPSGLIRATILGLKMMDIARQIKEKGISITKNQAFKDNIQLEILEQLKNVCDVDDLKNFNLTPDDIIALATGTINNIIAALKKLIKLLPITPINAEELRQIYEHAKQALIAA